MPGRKLGFTYFGGIGDCLRILMLFHGPLLHLLNRGKTPVRWNEGGSASKGLVNKHIISRVEGFYAPEPDEEFTQLLDFPRWQRFFRWTRRPMAFRLTAEEEAGLPKLATKKPNVAICPHHNGLACKKLPADSVNQLLALLRERLDAEYYVFDERVEPSSVNAPCIGGLNLAQAMVLMARFDGAFSVESWQKYILGMHGKPQSSLVVDCRINESFTLEMTPEGFYQEFFRWRMKPEEIVGFEEGYSGFKWMNAAQVDPAILAEHLLGQMAATGRYAGWLRK